MVAKGGGAVLIEEFIEQSDKSTTVDELFDSDKKTMERLGFDRLIFSLMTDHESIRREALQNRITYTTTVAGARALVHSLDFRGSPRVDSLQDLHRLIVTH